MTGNCLTAAMKWTLLLSHVARTFSKPLFIQLNIKHDEIIFFKKIFFTFLKTRNTSTLTHQPMKRSHILQQSRPSSCPIQPNSFLSLADILLVYTFDWVNHALFFLLQLCILNDIMHNNNLHISEPFSARGRHNMKNEKWRYLRLKWVSKVLTF